MTSVAAGALDSGALLTTHELSKSFGGVVAVEQASIRLPDGRVTAIIGPNGAGKSTLFNLITARIRPDSGRVVFRGRDITHLSTARIARLGVGRAFQDVRLFVDLSVLDNVAVYRQAAQSASLWRTLLLAPAQFRVDRLVRSESMGLLERLGIGQLAGERAGGVPFAGQKLVSLARLIALGSTLLLLDEPASGLDQAGRELLMGAVEGLGRDGYTVAIVEHNLDVVRRLASHVVFMAQGRMVAAGPPAAIFSSPELAEAYFGVRQTDDREAAH